ncbi:hypothetical protein B566_EDAN010085 [Ephemera danica]|nr:hypothetical protein B566_EDAN010085 [Ephemera danica]
MADQIEEDSIVLLKNKKILVNVEEALEDIIIVSFTHQGSVFQGALLNSTKKGLLPCGIIPPKDFLQPPPPVLHSPRPEDPPLSPVGLNQRFTYFQDKPGGKTPIILRRPIKPPSRYRKPNSKMTVRLRPRQVLCTKCKSKCLENSENVDVSSRATRSNPNPPPPAPETRAKKVLDTSAESSELNSAIKKEDDTKQKLAETSSDSKKASTTSDASDSKKLNKIKIVGNYWISPTRDPPDEQEDSTEKENSSESGDLTEDQERMVLRKKRSVGSMEDLWDESVFEDGQKKAKIDGSDPPRTTTPVIKISFGSSGQGTVLKIPAKIQNPDIEENSENKYHNAKDLVGEKAAKKALKKAKKETRRKMFGSPNQSPNSNIEIPRRHKHKVKHRKKHKESKHRDEMPRWNVSKTDQDYTAIKEQCLKQRLSISLKRLNANAYTRCDPSQEDSTPSNSCSPDSSSPDCSEEVPDFPASAINSGLTERSSPEASPTLMMRITTQSVQTCVTGDGRKMSVGDVVWGKIHGFPWWPGKVRTIWHGKFQVQY